MNTALNRLVAERLGHKPQIEFGLRRQSETNAYWFFTWSYPEAQEMLQDAQKYDNSHYSDSVIDPIERWPNYLTWPAAMELRDRVSQTGLSESFVENLHEILRAEYDVYSSYYAALLLQPHDICRAFLRATEVQGG